VFSAFLPALLNLFSASRKVYQQSQQHEIVCPAAGKIPWIIMIDLGNGAAGYTEATPVL
jgi:hypothetical protein